MEIKIIKTFWRDEYFNDLLKRLETNADIDPTVVEVDKKKYFRFIEKRSFNNDCWKIYWGNFKKI
jgi:ATP phosphoribosyltransferase regulatory subunit